MRLHKSSISWWSGIPDDIEMKTKKYTNCIKGGKNIKTEKLNSRRNKFENAKQRVMSFNPS